MCNQCTPPDPRDAIHDAALAVRALHALMLNAGHPCYGDAELPTLLEFIDERLFPAAEAIQHYVPREHPLAAA